MVSISPDDIKAWPKPNYVNPETQVAMLVGVQTPMLAIMLLIVAARFGDRIYSHMRFDASDWMMVPTTIFVVACNIIPLAAIPTGMGRHIWDFKEGWMSTNLKLTLAFRNLFSVAMALIKMSVLCSYLRFFPHNKVNVWFCRAMISFCACAAVAFIFICTFACSPPSDFWNTDPTKQRHCHNEDKILISAAIEKVATEVLVFIWPVWFVWTLDLPDKTRTSLTLLLSCGVVVSVVGIIKTGYMWYSFKHGPDFPWTAVRVFMLECLELDLCLLCACIPHIKRPFKAICCFPCRRRRENKKPQTPEAPRDMVRLFGPSPRQPPIAMRNLGNRRNGIVGRSLASTTNDNDFNDTILTIDGGEGRVGSPFLVGPRLSSPAPDHNVAVAMQDKLQRSSSLAMTTPPQSPLKKKKQSEQKSPGLPRSPGSMNMVDALREEALANSPSGKSDD